MKTRISEPVRPNLFVVGAPKCGTTSLHHYLAKHPDIFMCWHKELYRFCPDIRTLPLVQTESGYLSQFEEGRGKQWVGEITPLYLASEEAAWRIAEFNPSARIVMVLREPIAMMHALYGQHLHDCLPCHPDFETELRAQESGPRRGVSYVPPDFVRLPRLLDVADYAAQIRRFRSHFPAAQIKVILFDDLVRDTAGVYADLLGWLGLEPCGTAEFERYGSRRVHVHPLLIRAIRSVGGVTRILRRVSPGFVDYLSAVILSWGTRRLPPLDPADHARLQAEFFPDFSELESIIGRSLTHWRPSGDRESQAGQSALTTPSTGPAAPAGVERTQASTFRVLGQTPRPSAPLSSH